MLCWKNLHVKKDVKMKKKRKKPATTQLPTYATPTANPFMKVVAPTTTLGYQVRSKLKNWNVVIYCVTIYIDCNYRKNYFYFVHFLLLLSFSIIIPSKQTQTLSLTFLNFSTKLFNYIFTGADNTGTNNNEDACDESTAQYNCHNPNKFGNGVASRCNHCSCESTFEGKLFFF